MKYGLSSDKGLNRYKLEEEAVGVLTPIQDTSVTLTNNEFESKEGWLS